MGDQLFTHRPPSAGIHLLSDPLPERTESPASARASSERVVAARKRTRSRAKSRKGGLHA